MPVVALGSVLTVAVVCVGVATSVVVVVGVTSVVLVSVGVTTDVPVTSSGALDVDVPVDEVAVAAVSIDVSVVAFSVSTRSRLHAARVARAMQKNSLRIRESPSGRGQAKGEPGSASAQWRLAAAALIVVAAVRVASTYRVFSQITDEPVHLSSGYDWWTRGGAMMDSEHPPLARALFALPFIIRGTHDPGPGWLERGNALLWTDGQYRRNLAQVRLANLPFLILLLATIWMWARRDFGDRVALLAVALASSLPPILGHAGVATTDLPAAATLLFALFLFDRWLARPDLARAAALGIAIGLGITAKFSFLLFFPIAAVIVLAFRRKWPGASIAISCAIAAFVVLAMYRFHLETFVAGVKVLGQHTRRGHHAFLLGRVSQDGWWFYFPVAIFFKTPLALFALAFAGARRAPMHAAIAIALVAAVMPASINIGVRHVLPIYAPLAIVAAAGAVTLWRRSRLAVIALCGWLFIGTALAHPDYLAWFNEAAGREPGRILVDSNLDWGQDLLRLAQLTREKKIDRLNVLLFGSADLGRLGLPPHTIMNGWIPVQGWVAISETPYRMGLAEGAWTWLRGRPYTPVGKSIRLYYVP